MRKYLFKILLMICLILSATFISYAETNAATINEAAGDLREGLKNRENSIIVFCETTEEDHSSVLNNIINEALKHTGISTEGDYIKFHLMNDLTGRITNKVFENDVYKLEIKFSPRYLSTYDQEQELTSKLNDFYDTLDLNMSSYDKLKSIYDYICDNVAYGFTNNSAYSALINGSSSCRGYALLFYRMALDLGFDARIIPGRVVGGNYDNYHEWNIVKIGNKYYNIDANFGDNVGGQARYTYFLKGANGIFNDGYGDVVPSHIRKESYNTVEFNALYPMSEKDYSKKDEPEVPTEKPEETTTEQESTTEDKEEPKKEILIGNGNIIIKGPIIKLKKFTNVISKFFGSLWR